MNVIKKAVFKVLAKGSGPMIQHMFLMTGDFGKALYNKNGKESLPMITEIASKRGVGMAEITRKMMPVNTMKDADEAYNLMDSIMELGIEPIESSSDVFHFKITKCPYGLEGTNKELCEAMMVTDKQMLSTLLGQQVQMKILQSVAAGDKTCEVVFSK
jgi:predicted hydrocarbon binding protein